jgi:hypothetical protein
MGDYEVAICYTTDGSTPTISSTEYSAPINVSATMTINAIEYSFENGLALSPMASATYTINPVVVATPTFNPPTGTYTGTQTVAISCATTGANIYYTTDGSIPSTASTVYSGPINVSATTTINAFATEAGMSNSFMASATYTINLNSVNIPVITSGPTADPAAPNIWQPVTFSVVASDEAGDLLGYAWDFGDSSPVQTGSTTTHSYSLAGVYAVSVVISSGYPGGFVTGTMNITVDHNDVNVLKKKLTLNFKKPSMGDGLDITLFSTTYFQVLNKIQFLTEATNTQTAVYVGNTCIDSATLYGGKGIGFTSFGKFTWNPKQGTFRYFTTKGTLQALLAPYGATNATAVGTKVALPISFVIDGQWYAGSMPFTYFAIPGKWGKGF